MRTAIVAPKLVMRTVLAGMAVASLVAGCSPTKDGTPTTASGTPTNDGKNLFNPCTGLSDAALQATKVDPASKTVVTDPPTGGVVARICRWDSIEGPYGVTVSSLTYTLADLRKNDRVTVVRDVQIGSRSGLISLDKADQDKLRCNISLPASQGMVEVAVGWDYSERASLPQAPPCDLDVRHAQELEPFLPK
ncbi:DUF3558 domain-containing protein [Nocardia sp. NPDC046473]|uniref:DUF3558 domain-containing protein n=1 Tax=Nocardia sp. NPDC046473 TaxID=3155733 RepID=UPI0033F071CD